MMPLWLDLLRTPMAAPETRGLRRMRHGWQALCLALALSVAAFPRLRAAGGVCAAFPVAVLLIAVTFLGAWYFWRKHRADAAHLDRSTGAQG